MYALGNEVIGLKSVMDCKERNEGKRENYERREDGKLTTREIANELQFLKVMVLPRASGKGISSLNVCQLNVCRLTSQATLGTTYSMH